MMVRCPKLRNMAHTTSLCTLSLLPKDQTFIFYLHVHKALTQAKQTNILLITFRRDAFVLRTSVYDTIRKSRCKHTCYDIYSCLGDVSSKICCHLRLFAANVFQSRLLKIAKITSSLFSLIIGHE